MRKRLTDISTIEVSMANQVRVCYPSKSISCLEDVKILYTYVFEILQSSRPAACTTALLPTAVRVLIGLSDVQVLH